AVDHGLDAVGVRGRTRVADSPAAGVPTLPRCDRPLLDRTEVGPSDGVDHLLHDRLVVAVDPRADEVADTAGVDAATEGVAEGIARAASIQAPGQLSDGPQIEVCRQRGRDVGGLTLGL